MKLIEALDEYLKNRENYHYAKKYAKDPDELYWAKNEMEEAGKELASVIIDLRNKEE
jgi:O-succinylbenzoate synthase